MSKAEWKNEEYLNSIFDSMLCGVIQYEARETNRIVFANKIAAVQMGYRSVEELMQQNFKDIPKRIVEEDFVTLLRMQEKLLKPEDKVYGEYRVKLSNGEIHWYYCTLKRLEAVRGEVVYQMESVNITEKMKKSIQNHGKREFRKSDRVMEGVLDQMTGTIQKEFGVSMVKEYLESKENQPAYALMLLDLDDFVELNQREGTAFSDAVLKDTADTLKEVLKKDDLIIRIGGDEFMILLKDVTKGQAHQVGEKMTEKVSNILGSNSLYKLSVSIGVCSSSMADTYDELYHCADSALQYAKEEKRGGVISYTAMSNKLGTGLGEIYKHHRRVTKIMNDKSDEDDLLSFGLELLGKSKNLQASITLLLSRIGRRLDLDRVSITEVNRESHYYQIYYEWMRDPKWSRCGQIIHLNEKKWKELQEENQIKGTMVNIPLEDEEVMSSYCHAPIYDRGRYTGALIFEKNKENVHWTNSEQRLASEMAKLIFTFIQKQKSDTIVQTKTDFLSRMSHEIRTPMNAIYGMTEIAKSVVGDKKRTLECLSQIETANEYLLSLISDILDFSRIESGKVELNLQPTDVNEQIDILNSLVMPQMKKKRLHYIIQNHYSEKRLLSCDKIRIQQVLVNIIGNAVKFTPEEGTIQFSVDPLEEDSESVTLRFSVRDSGIGISPEAQEHIFHAFEQADTTTYGNYGGTGLGLAISSKLVELMGGKLEVASQQGIGSDFYFTLRIAYSKQIERIEIEEEDYQVDLSGKRVLFAEDNALNQEILIELLGMHGMKAEAADNGKQAVEMFLEKNPYYYDAILMDIQMPIMNGLIAAKKIRESHKADARGIPIIAMTANAFQEDIQKSMESGMNGHLVKPVDTKKMLTMLEQTIEQSKK